MRPRYLFFDPNDETGGGTPPPEPNPPADKTFTQADVDRIVQERIARVKAQPPADYDDLKAAAARLEEIEAKQKSELEKANERAAKLEREIALSNERAQRILVDSAIVSAAAGKLADPSDAVALVDRAAIEFADDGQPTNVAQLVDKLIEAKPHLSAARPTGSADQGARGTGSVKPVTREELKTMSDTEYLKARQEGRITALLAQQ